MQSKRLFKSLFKILFLFFHFHSFMQSRSSSKKKRCDKNWNQRIFYAALSVSASACTWMLLNKRAHQWHEWMCAGLLYLFLLISKFWIICLFFELFFSFRIFFVIFFRSDLFMSFHALMKAQTHTNTQTHRHRRTNTHTQSRTRRRTNTHTQLMKCTRTSMLTSTCLHMHDSF